MTDAQEPTHSPDNGASDSHRASRLFGGGGRRFGGGGRRPGQYGRAVGPQGPSLSSGAIVGIMGLVVLLTAVPLDIADLLADPRVGAVLHAGQPSVQALGVGVRPAVALPTL